MTATDTQDGLDARSPAISVALMNDYEVVVRGLAQMLDPYDDRVRVVELDVNLTPASQVDITMYDTFAVPQAGHGAIPELVTNSLAGRVVVYAWEIDADLVRAGLAAGVAGYLPKTLSADELVNALERVHAGERVIHETISAEPPPENAVDHESAGHAWPGRDFGLTHRESEMLALITQGLSNQDIATRCYLSMNTVKSYIRGTYRKIDVDTRARAVIWGMNHGMALDQIRVTRPQTQHARGPAAGS